MARVLCWRRLELKRSSLILLSASVSECSLSRMVKSMIPLGYYEGGQVGVGCFEHDVNLFRVTSFVPRDGCLNFIDENDGILACSLR